MISMAKFLATQIETDQATRYRTIAYISGVPIELLQQDWHITELLSLGKGNDNTAMII